MTAERLAAVVITKDAEPRLQSCLESVRWADEIVVVDAFSRDRTVEIARRYADHVFQHDWQGFARQRNLGAERASHAWILSIDGDEEVTPLLRDEIRETLISPAHAGYRIPRRNFMFGRWMRFGGLGRQYHLRLYDRRKGRWIGEVHETVAVDGTTGRLGVSMLHHAYESVGAMIHKVDVYTDLEARTLFEQGRRERPWEILRETAGTFLYKYLWQLGFLDGYPGLLWAASLGYYHLLKWAKVRELRRPTAGPRSPVDQPATRP